LEKVAINFGRDYRKFSVHTFIHPGPSTMHFLYGLLVGPGSTQCYCEERYFLIISAMVIWQTFFTHCFSRFWKRGCL